jgi:hypothetical protein
VSGPVGDAAGAVPEEVRRAVEGTPAVGALDAAFELLTVDPDGRVDVCLLSRNEVEAGPTALRLVVASTKARRNLYATGRATFLAVAGDAAHYLALRVRRVVEEDGAMAAELEVERDLRDDLDVELHPIRFRVEERLAAEERWDRTRELLARLASGGAPS